MPKAFLILFICLTSICQGQPLESTLFEGDSVFVYPYPVLVGKSARSNLLAYRNTAGFEDSDEALYPPDRPLPNGDYVAYFQFDDPAQSNKGTPIVAARFQLFNNQKEGPFSWFHYNGKPAIHGAFLEDLPHGKWAYYNLKSKLIAEANYEHGLAHGPQKQYQAKGKLRIETTYNHGVKDFYRRFYPSGKLKETGRKSQRGRPQGKITHYRKNGSIQRIERYTDTLQLAGGSIFYVPQPLKHGEQEYYNKKSKLIGKETYLADVLIESDTFYHRNKRIQRVTYLKYDPEGDEEKTLIISERYHSNGRPAQISKASQHTNEAVYNLECDKRGDTIFYYDTRSIYDPRSLAAPVRSVTKKSTLLNRGRVHQASGYGFVEHYGRHSAFRVKILAYDTVSKQLRFKKSLSDDKGFALDYYITVDHGPEDVFNVFEELEHVDSSRMFLNGLPYNGSARIWLADIDLRETVEVNSSRGGTMLELQIGPITVPERFDETSYETTNPPHRRDDDWYANNEVVSSFGAYEDGRRQGAWFSISDNDSMVREANYEKGELHGTMKEFVFMEPFDASVETTPSYRVLSRTANFEAGKLREETIYHINGQPYKHRLFDEEANLSREREYDTVGNLLSDYPFQNGKEHGVWKQYSSTGELVGQRQFEDGILFGKVFLKEGIHHYEGEVNKQMFSGLLTSYNDDGIKIHETVVSPADSSTFFRASGRLVTGYRSIFYPDGSTVSEGRMKDGKRAGKWKFRNPDGAMIREIDYTAAKTEVLDGQRLDHLGYFQSWHPNGTPYLEGYILSEEALFSCENLAENRVQNLLVISCHDESGKPTVSAGAGDLVLYDLQGRKTAEGGILNGIRNGLWKHYNSFGHLEAVGRYQKDVKEGKWLSGDLEKINDLENMCYAEEKFTPEELDEARKKIRIEETFYRNGKLMWRNDFVRYLNE